MNDVAFASGFHFVGPTQNITVGSNEFITLSGTLSVLPRTTSTYPYQSTGCIRFGSNPSTMTGVFSVEANRDGWQTLPTSVASNVLPPGTYEVGLCLFANSAGYDFHQILVAGYGQVWKA